MEREDPERKDRAMALAATETPISDLSYDYQTACSEELSDIRGYLYQKRKQGWKLYWIEGRSLHFRRRRTDGVARAA